MVLITCLSSLKASPPTKTWGSFMFAEGNVRGGGNITRSLIGLPIFDFRNMPASP